MCSVLYRCCLQFFDFVFIIIIIINIIIIIIIIVIIIIFAIYSQDSVVFLVNKLQIGSPRICVRFAAKAMIFSPFLDDCRSAPGTHPDVYSMNTVAPTWGTVEWPGRDSDRCHLSISRLKMTETLTLILLIYS